MPRSIDPPLADDEIECARCGARFYYELTRCPNCGVNLYEPEEEPELHNENASDGTRSRLNKKNSRMEDFIRRLTKRPYRVDTLFGAAINQAELFNNLLAKAGGDYAAVERLIAYEKQQAPQGNRILWLERAIQHWERDNRAPETKS